MVAGVLHGTGPPPASIGNPPAFLHISMQQAPGVSRSNRRPVTRRARCALPVSGSSRQNLDTSAHHDLGNGARTQLAARSEIHRPFTVSFAYFQNLFRGFYSGGGTYRERPRGTVLHTVKAVLLLEFDPAVGAGARNT